MAIPDFQAFMLPLLRIAGDGQPHAIVDAVTQLGDEFQLSEAEKAEPLKSGGTRLYNRVGWARTYLVKAGLLRKVGMGQFEVTERGRALLANPPPKLDVDYLKANFPEMAAFHGEDMQEDPPAVFDTSSGNWSQRPGIAQRIEDKLTRSMGDAAVRRQALEFLGWAIEAADGEQSDAWYLRETGQGLRLMAGRLLALEIKRSKLRVSVIGPVSEEIMSNLAAQVEDELKWVPGGVVLSLPLDRAAMAQAALKNGVESFLDNVTARVRRSVSLEDHAPEAVEYLSKELGRELPQPGPKSEQDATVELDDDLDETDVVAAREPKVRGRARIFETAERSIGSLVSDIELGVIALPDLQRPFVWEDTKVRDLLDSLFIGFPVGTLVFWHPSDEKEARALGAKRPDLMATTLVIDGQQRLTSLYAVMKGEEVIGKDGDMRKITIAFRPRDGRFEVADAAIRNDPEFIPDITELWKGQRTKAQIRRDLIATLNEKGRPVDRSYEDAVEANLERAHSLSEYSFPTVNIRRKAATQAGEATEEDVAEIFVRINNQGARLGQADFVLTLLSVYHGELRDLLEARASELSRGAVVTLDTQQLLRAACGVAFDRARMSAVYRSLRGVDPVTGEATPDRRLQLLQRLDEAARDCVDPTRWRDYLLRVKHAGFVNESLIASKNAIVNAYAFYVRGRRLGVAKPELDAVIARWVFGSLLTARYSGSSESAFEQDLSLLTRAGDDSFTRELDKALLETLTSDYWTLTLVSALATQKARAPVALAFRAEQVVLGARALFSDQLLQNLFDPSADGARVAREAHHLFPIKWLRSHGISDRREINQVANLADVGWHENSEARSESPATYVPRLRES